MGNVCAVLGVYSWTMGSLDYPDLTLSHGQCVSSIWVCFFVKGSMCADFGVDLNHR